MKKILIYLLLLLFSSCKEENQAPTCMIQNPTDNSEFLRGDSITISVEASDPDGLIRQVGLFMDEDSLTTITRLPYTYKFETSDITAGQHLIKASAINVEGIEASDSRNITIHQILLVLTAGITDISKTSALSGGTVKDDGGSQVTARGICWSTSPGPSLADNKTTNGSDIGSFTSKITGLSPGTTYYVRAYASNNIETKYGMENSFTTYIGSVTDYDGNVYGTIQIDDQTWMAENLRTTHYPDGLAITQTESNDLWVGTKQSYCWYDNDIVNKDIYGALYQWYAASRVCPDGWHLPSYAEWTEMIDYLGGPSIAGGKMKETGNTHWTSPNTGATNESGFNALPGGLRGWHDGEFIASGATPWATAFFWTSTRRNDDNTAAFAIGIKYDDAGVGLAEWVVQSGYSVRCVKDQSP